MRFTGLFRNLGLSFVLVFMMFPVSAADSKSADEWQFEGNLYLWGAAIDATPDGGEKIHLSFSDLIDNLNMAFMGGLGARKGKWSLLSDVLYLNVEADKKARRAWLAKTSVPKLKLSWRLGSLAWPEVTG